MFTKKMKVWLIIGVILSIAGWVAVGSGVGIFAGLFCFSYVVEEFVKLANTENVKEKEFPVYKKEKVEDEDEDDEDPFELKKDTSKMSTKEQLDYLAEKIDKRSEVKKYDNMEFDAIDECVEVN